MRKLSLEGGVGVSQIFRVDTAFPEGGAPHSENGCVESPAPGVANTLLQQGAGTGQGGAGRGGSEGGRGLFPKGLVGHAEC